MMSEPLDHAHFMGLAIDLARKAAAQAEVPVGALIVTRSGEIVAEAYNQKESQPSALAHAEMLAIAEASKKLGRWRLHGLKLYVTLEPCLMCAGAIIASRLDEVIYGAKDLKAGAVESLYTTLSDSRLNHRPKVTSGILEEECGQLLKEFFRARRAKSDIG